MVAKRSVMGSEPLFKTAEFIQSARPHTQNSLNSRSTITQADFSLRSTTCGHERATSSCFFPKHLLLICMFSRPDPKNWQTEYNHTSRHTVIPVAHTRKCHPLPVTLSKPESRQWAPDFVPVPLIHGCFKGGARLKRACTLRSSPRFFSSAPPRQLWAAQLLEFEWDWRRWEELLKRCRGYIDLTYPCLRVHGATPRCEEGLWIQWNKQLWSFAENTKPNGNDYKNKTLRTFFLAGVSTYAPKEKNTWIWTFWMFLGFFCLPTTQKNSQVGFPSQFPSTDARVSQLREKHVSHIFHSLYTSSLAALSLHAT